MTEVVVGPTPKASVTVRTTPGVAVNSPVVKPIPVVLPSGKEGPPGPPGSPGSAYPIVTVPYNEWPPTDPQPDTLYLRLAP